MLRYGPSIGLSIGSSIVSLFFIVVVILVQILLSFQMKKIAEQKGQNGKSSFWLSLFFGVFGWAYTAMLPDLVRRKQMEELIAAQKNTSGE